MTDFTAYYFDWLATRYAFDEKARNKQIEQQFLHFLTRNKTVRLIDVGAGSGANCRYWIDKIPGNQQWILIEENPDFSKKSLSALQQFAQARGYACSLQKESLHIQTPTQTIHIKTIQGSLLEIDQLASLSDTDAVVANAVYDLLTKDQFEEFISKIAPHRLVFLATLNYQNMHFSPALPADEKMIGLYHAHMLRPQEEGVAMGPSCVAQMQETLQKHNYTLVVGESIWEIRNKDDKMMEFLLDFMESSIGELSLSSEDSLLLKAWIKQKREANNLKLTIEHQDILGSFA